MQPQQDPVNAEQLPPLSQTQSATLEVPPEPVQEKEKRSLGCSCRSLSCFGCIGIIVLIGLLFAILYFRPPFIWNSVKVYLNNDYRPVEHLDVGTRSITDSINLELGSVGETEIGEDQAQALVRDFLNSEDIRVDIEPGYLRLVTDIENDEDYPLWLILEISQDSEGNASVTKFGFQRLDTPEFLQKNISDGVFEALDLSNTGESDDAIQLISMIIDADDEGITLENVRFDKDQITIMGTHNDSSD